MRVLTVDPRPKYRFRRPRSQRLYRQKKMRSLDRPCAQCSEPDVL